MSYNVNNVCLIWRDNSEILIKKIIMSENNSAKFLTTNQPFCFQAKLRILTEKKTIAAKIKNAVTASFSFSLFFPFFLSGKPERYH